MNSFYTPFNGSTQHIQQNKQTNKNKQTGITMPIYAAKNEHEYLF